MLGFLGMGWSNGFHWNGEPHRSISQEICKLVYDVGLKRLRVMKNFIKRSDQKKVQLFAVSSFVEKKAGLFFLNFPVHMRGYSVENIR